MLARNIIESEKTKWAAFIVFVFKNYGTFQFFVGYRKFNAAAKRDSNPILRMDKCIASLGEATIFFKLDPNSAICQINIEDINKNGTDFTIRHELYKFIKMPFARRNASEMFQRTTDVILLSVKWQLALVYLGGIKIFNKTLGQLI